MKVLMTTDAVGGVWTYALDLAGGFAGHGITTMLAVLGPAPDAVQRAAAAAVPGLRLLPTGLELDWMAPSPAAIAAAAASMARLAVAHGADIVHLNSPALAAASYPMPVVCVCHSCVATWWDAVHGTMLPADLAWRTAALARGYAAADALIAPTAAFASATAAAYGLAHAPVVVRNGRAMPVAVSDGAPEHAVFMAGRLWDAGKGAATLDAAAASIEAPVCAAGPVQGPQGGALALANMRALGRLSATEVATRLARRPVFVAPSCYEPFGLAVLEAAQAGCALVLSDLPAFRELWDGAATFFPPRDGAALAAAVNGLLRAPDRRDAGGRAATERARRYDVGAMTACVLAVHRQVQATCQRGKAA